MKRLSETDISWISKLENKISTKQHISIASVEVHFVICAFILLAGTKRLSETDTSWMLQLINKISRKQHIHVFCSCKLHYWRDKKAISKKYLLEFTAYQNKNPQTNNISITSEDVNYILAG